MTIKHISFGLEPPQLLVVGNPPQKVFVFIVAVNVGGRCGRVVECRTFGRVDRGSKPPAVVSFIPLCPYLSALKAAGPFYLVSTFYLVSMPGVVKYSTNGVNV